MKIILTSLLLCLSCIAFSQNEHRINLFANHTIDNQPTKSGDINLGGSFGYEYWLQQTDNVYIKPNISFDYFTITNNVGNVTTIYGFDTGIDAVLNTDPITLSAGPSYYITKGETKQPAIVELNKNFLGLNASLGYISKGGAIFGILYKADLDSSVDLDVVGVGVRSRIGKK